jgi:hypothetical protein
MTKKSMRRFCAALLALACSAAAAPLARAAEPASVSGRYPSLAMFNRQGECGTGAVVPWAGKLWVITYAPHQSKGSDDQLYEISPGLAQTIRPESVGGTPADRLIHRETNQLLIGPYVIDAEGKVRVVTPKAMPGRLTAAARHLTNPAEMVYVYDMEGMLYELNVKTLEPRQLFEKAVPGWHGKGAYSSQGRLVTANNGGLHVGSKKYKYDAGAEATNDEEAGALAEWDGKQWRIVERRQFTDVTGPGGINGQTNDADPIWSIGWDKRSLILKLLDGGRWYTFRLPKADYSYDGRHGWHTEWPRIREVTGGHYLMNMHGGWFEFPRTFSAANTAGLRPIASYLKVTGDFTDWNGRLVFGCDDAALATFLQGNNPLVGQSQSNLWFTQWDDLPKNGAPGGWGGVWVRDDVKAAARSAPFLIGGYAKRTLHLSHASGSPINVKVEIDADGKGAWTAYQTLAVPANGYAAHVFPDEVKGEWVRLTPETDATKLTAYFHFGAAGGAVAEPEMFASIPAAGASPVARSAGVAWLSRDGGKLLYAAKSVGADGKVADAGVFEMGPEMKFVPSDEKLPAKDLTPEVVASADGASAIIDDGKRRYRVPKGSNAFDAPDAVPARVIREVVTERSILNVHGTFYVLPRPNSGGVPHIKPIATHNKRITDFCSWRGLMVLTGTIAGAPTTDGHTFAAADGRAGLWLGDIDDLWRLGKPRGKGGPWLDTAVDAGKPSDPYLMTGYDKKHLELSHQAQEPVKITLEIDAAADGNWTPYQTFDVPQGETVKFDFPPGYSAHWLRVTADKPCKASAQLTYE